MPQLASGKRHYLLLPGDMADVDGPSVQARQQDDCRRRPSLGVAAERDVLGPLLKVLREDASTLTA